MSAFIGDLASAVCFTAILFTCAWVIGWAKNGIEYAYDLFAVADAGFAVQFALEGDWLFSSFFVVGAISCATVWWNRRRKRRDPAARSVGEKSRALRDALVRKAREVSVPRPVLRPAPEGAPC